MNTCRWCDDPSGSEQLCAFCRGEPAAIAAFRCEADPSHEHYGRGACATCARNAVKRERARALVEVQAIRAALVRDFHRPWPGCDFGKVLLGRSLDGVTEDLS